MPCPWHDASSSLEGKQPEYSWVPYVSEERIADHEHPSYMKCTYYRTTCFIQKHEKKAVN